MPPPSFCWRSVVAGSSECPFGVEEVRGHFAVLSRNDCAVSARYARVGLATNQESLRLVITRMRTRWFSVNRFAHSVGSPAPRRERTRSDHAHRPLFTQRGPCRQARGQARSGG